MTRPTQSDFIRVLMVLNERQTTATTPEEREEADHELKHALRMNAAGRFHEYLASRKGAV